jgi:hypothetical protein
MDCYSGVTSHRIPPPGQFDGSAIRNFFLLPGRHYQRRPIRSSRTEPELSSGRSQICLSKSQLKQSWGRKSETRVFALPQSFAAVAQEYHESGKQRCQNPCHGIPELLRASIKIPDVRFCGRGLEYLAAQLLGKPRGCDLPEADCVCIAIFSHMIRYGRID